VFVWCATKAVFFTCSAQAILCIEICALEEIVQNTLGESAEHESQSTFGRWEIARAEHICAAIHIRCATTGVAVWCGGTLRSDNLCHQN
jgi:hypothetical protein